jgi:ribosomal protein S18 acetylase RimI-like enzyme
VGRVGGRGGGSGLVSSGAARAPDVGPLLAHEARSAAELLARAFRDNPLNVAAIRSADLGRRLRASRPGARDLVASALRHGEVWAAREAERPLGALVATPPGHHPLPPPPLARRLLSLAVQGWGTARRWGEIFEALQLLHPPDPHWYLGTLGVDPVQQGRGVGTALLRTWLRSVDREAGSVYLETDRERNVSWYEREGFCVVCRTRVLEVPVWCMQRPAREP